MAVTIEKAGDTAILLSIPHCGTAIPEPLGVHPHLRACPPDTDWFLQQLYDFAGELGIATVHAYYSRYVVDLNRTVNSGALYSDGRRETGVIPDLTFAGEPLYDQGTALSSAECRQRVQTYYDPYYACLRQRLDSMRQKFAHVLLFDAHSIRRCVPRIRDDAFPDLILGSNDGKSAAQRLIETAQKALKHGNNFELCYNDPFKGGAITRSIGQPDQGIHALQLEMSQDLYMQEWPPCYGAEKTNIVREQLKMLFQALLGCLDQMNASR